MKDFNYDLVCVGGGLNGVSLAVDNAKNGKKVLIIEKNEFLGGSAVAGFKIKDADTSTVFFKEFETKMNERKGLLKTASNSYTVNPELVKFVLLDMCKEYNVDLLLHSVVCDLKKKNGTIESITVFGKGSRVEVKAKTFADTTGTGELAVMAGVECEDCGKYEADYSFTVCNYTASEVKPEFHGAVIEPSAEGGRLLVTLEKETFDSLTPETIPEVLYKFSCKALDFLATARKELKGFENCKISAAPPMLNVKSSKKFRKTE